jgi:aryl-alcohol dehydrogenase-like predicted oxidoreductase
MLRRPGGRERVLLTIVPRHGFPPVRRPGVRETTSARTAREGAAGRAVEQLAEVADEAGLTMIQLALGFVTAHPAVTSALIGPRTLDHLQAQLAAADTVLSADVLDAIDAIVAPGVDLAAHEKYDTPPALPAPSLRRR